MVTIRFTGPLKNAFPDLVTGESVEGATIAEVLAALDQRHPGFSAFLLNEEGALRPQVSIFVGQNRITDPAQLTDPISPESRIYIMHLGTGG